MVSVQAQNEPFFWQKKWPFSPSYCGFEEWVIYPSNSGFYGVFFMLLHLHDDSPPFWRKLKIFDFLTLYVLSDKAQNEPFFWPKMAVFSKLVGILSMGHIATDWGFNGVFYLC